MFNVVANSPAGLWTSTWYVSIGALICDLALKIDFLDDSRRWQPPRQGKSMGVRRSIGPGASPDAI